MQTKNDAEKAQVKTARPKRGTVVEIEEFLGLKRPKGDLLLKIGRDHVRLQVWNAFTGPKKN